jgi:hypothetical protein
VRSKITVLSPLEKRQKLWFPALCEQDTPKLEVFRSMKILVMPRPIEGVSREEMLPHAPAEIQAVWELYKQGIVREFYTRANETGRVVLVLESSSEEAAKDALSSLPFVQLHLIDFDIVPLAPFYGLENLSAQRM